MISSSQFNKFCVFIGHRFAFNFLRVFKLIQTVLIGLNIIIWYYQLSEAELEDIEKTLRATLCRSGQ